MLQVYRVEDEDGVGPYRSDKNYVAFALFGGDALSNGARPCPWYDNLKQFGDSHFFGFESMEQLLEWFPRECLQRLFDAGFRVRVYAVAPDYVMRGGKQVAFIKDQARQLREVTL